MAWAAAAYAVGKASYDVARSDEYGAKAKAKSNEEQDAYEAWASKRKGALSEAYNTSDSDAFRGALGGYAKGVMGRRAPQAGPAAQAGPAWANAAHIDTAQSDATRAQQQNALAMLAAQAAGKGPSVATQQMKANVDASNAANMAFAASARGHVNPMLAARQASMSNAANLQAGARDSAMLRTQEQINGQNAYAQMLAGVRGQDMQGAQAQAGFAQQANLANAGFQQQSGMFNADASNKIALANMEAQLRARGMDDAQIGSILAMEQAQMNQDKQNKLAAWGADADNTRFYANLGQQANMYNQNRRDQQNAALGQAIGSGVGYAADAYGKGGGSAGSNPLASYYDSSGL